MAGAEEGQVVKGAAVAVVGGTGRQGFGLALRWARAGYQVVIGSRDPVRAREVAERVVALRASVAGEPAGGWPDVAGVANAEAVATGEVVVLTIPWFAQPDVLPPLRERLAGRVVVDATVPLAQLRPPRLQEFAEGSSAQRVQALLPGARVAAAFHTVSAAKLGDLRQSLQEDTLICADDQRARELVAELAAAIGLRPVDAGSLDQARSLEVLACLVIGLNQRYRRHGIGIRLEGL